MKMHKIKLSDLKSYLSPYERKGFLPNIIPNKASHHPIWESISDIDHNTLSALNAKDASIHNWLNVWGNAWGNFAAHKAST